MSKIPEGATHEGKGECRFYVKDLIPGVSFSFCNEKSDGTFTNWRKSDSATPSYAITPIPRDWNGPEDGLPPVGLEVEAYFPKDTRPQWLKTTFLYVSDHVVVYTDIFDEIHKSRAEFDKLGVKLRPIRTAEQLAAEERASQIELMADIFRDAPQVGVQAGMAALYDAGYRLVQP